MNTRVFTRDAESPGMGLSSETDRNLLVFCLMSFHVQFNLTSPHVDGGVVKVKAPLGVCSFDQLLDAY